MKKTYLFLFLFFFILYLLNTPYSIVFGDSPELSLASYSLGIAHPPGYPLFSILSKTFSYLLPLTDYAQKCNIFSSFISSISVILLFISLFSITKSYFASMISSLTLGFSYTFFKQSLIAEVYALNSFFVILITFCITKFNKEKDLKWFYLSCFLCGIGLGNHHTLLGIFFSVLIFYFLKKSPLKQFLIGIAFFLLGLSIYFYLPIRSLTNPVLDWGDPENLQNFYNVITRQQFGFGGGEYSFYRLISQLIYYISLINKNFFLPAIITALLGFISFFKKDIKLGIYLTLIFLINGMLTYFVLNPEKSEFFLVEEFITPSIIVFSILLGSGISYIKSFSKILYFIIIPVLMITLTMKFYLQKNEISRKDDFFAFQLAKDICDILPEKSIIVGEADYSIFPILYMKNFYYKNKDIIILDADFFMLPWYQEQNLQKLPFLKNLMPDISMHSKDGNKNKKIDFIDLETYKLNQSQKLADNIMEQLRRPVFFTNELYEISKMYNHPLKDYLKQYGIVYIYRGEENKKFNFSLDIFLKDINLTEEETFFLKPYIPYLSERAFTNYLQNNLLNAERLFGAINKLNPTMENALNYAILLAMNGKIEKAYSIENQLYRTVLKFDPRFTLLQGIIRVHDRDYKNALYFLKIAETSNTSACEAKLYIFKSYLDTKQKELAKFYYEQIMSNCPNNIQLRANEFTKNFKN